MKFRRHPLSDSSSGRRPPFISRVVGRFRRWNESGLTRKLVYLWLGLTGLGLGVLYGSWSRACAGTTCPSISVLEGYRPSQTTKVYAADGRLITELGIERRTVLSFEEISPALRAAFVAIEDQRFYQHGGIDPRAFLRAVKVNLLEGRREGASTITMQLARNVFPRKLPSGKTIQRKVREMQVAREIERTYDKDRILELYLNQIYMGGPAYGVEAGSHRYFGKSARDVNVAEAALIAAIANIPALYDPRRHPDRALRRRNLVITSMEQQRYLSHEEAEGWRAYPVVLSSRVDFREEAPYFVEWVRRKLFDWFGEGIYQRGFRVYTTLDLDMQLAGERALEEQIERIENGELGAYRHITYQQDLEAGREPSIERAETPYLQGALITLDVDSGYVRAMVGGRDFSDSEFNRATQALRQAGSTFKPFVFTAAIRAGRPASYIVADDPISLEFPGDTLPWEPQNFTLDFRGPMTLRNGLRLSRNLVAIRLGRELGEQVIVGEARRFGISTRLDPYPSVHIGSASVLPIEMASAYTAFATLGTRVAPIGILRVEDERGNIIREQRVSRQRVIDPEHMWLVTNMLEGVMSRGTASGAVRTRGGFLHPAGGKTGTTNDGSDVWFIGFTSELVTVLWMGFDQPRKIKARASGGLLAAPAWAAYMNEVHERRPAPDGWQRPDGLILLRVDNTTGFLTTGWCPREVTYHEWFVPGTEPVEYCPVHNPFVGGISFVPGSASPNTTRRP